MRLFNVGSVTVALAAILTVPTIAAGPLVGTAFTYQGELQQSGQPVNTTADFQFSLFALASGGSALAGPLVVNNLTLSEGRFTVSLDFGANVFDGNDRYLEIAVRSPAGSGVFTTLTPRQRIAPTPYSLQTRGIFVDQLGKVGIGTTTPESTLHVHKNSAGLISAQPNATLVLENFSNNYLNIFTPDAFEAGILFGRPNAPVNNATGGIVYNSAGTPDGMQFRTNGNTTRMVIDNAGNVGIYGNVGIGTVIPFHPLHVEGLDVPKTIFATTDDGTALVGHSFGFSGSGIGVEGQGDGPGAIGVQGLVSSSDGQCWGVVGQATAPTGNAVGVLGTSQSVSGFDFLAFGSGTNYGAASSIRWKRNIELVGDALNKVDQLRGVYFDWDAEHGGHHDVGMIAEEVGAVLPEIVNYEENGIDAIGMDYSKLTPLLVEAVKALRAQQDTEIAALQAENDSLRRRLDALEEIVTTFAPGQNAGNQ